MAKRTKTADEKSDFGAAYRELEEIVAWFEKGEVDLDAGLDKFERGLALAKSCKERLRDVENRVRAIKVKFGESGGGGDDEG